MCELAEGEVNQLKYTTQFFHFLVVWIPKFLLYSWLSVAIYRLHFMLHILHCSNQARTNVPGRSLSQISRMCPLFLWISWSPWSFRDFPHQVPSNPQGQPSTAAVRAREANEIRPGGAKRGQPPSRRGAGFELGPANGWRETTETRCHSEIIGKHVDWTV